MTADSNPPTRRLGRGLDALLAKRPLVSQNPPSSDTDTGSTAGSTASRAEHIASNTEAATAKSQISANASTSANTISKASAAATAAAAADDAAAAEAAGSFRLVRIADIRPNPFQPRKEFRQEELADLQASLKASGLLQPITVRPAPGANGKGYELIAGERRFRAASNLGWTDIPALIRSVDDQTLLTLAMIENLQRADLDPIEEADGYQRLVDEFSLTHQEVADVVGKDRSTIANALRLRQLPASVRRMLQQKQLTAGHARALIPLNQERQIIDLAREIVARHLSVREVERRVQAARKPANTSDSAAAAAGAQSAPPPPSKPQTGQSSATNATVRQIEDQLRRKLQTSVSLSLTGKDKGELKIAFFSNDDLERLLEILGVSLD